MLGPTNFWMCLAGFVFLVAGVIVRRRDLSAARGADKLIVLGPVFIAVSLATFAPEHFRGPDYIQQVVPSYMPARADWPYFIGSVLLLAATSLALRKYERLSSSLLGLMFFLFVCMIYLPGPIKHPTSRFAWTFVLRELSFSAGATALAGFYGRTLAPRSSKWMIGYGHVVLAIAAIFYGIQNLLHPEFAPGVPLQLKTPSWVPIAPLWGYVAGAVLLIAGIALALNRKTRIAAASIGALMTLLTLFLYLPILGLAHGADPVNEALNYLADTLLYAGSALGVAAAMPADR